MADMRTAAGPSLNDIKIDLGKADEEVNTKAPAAAGGDDELSDIPTGDDSNKGQEGDLGTSGGDFGAGFGADAGEDKKPEEKPAEESPFEAPAAPAPAAPVEDKSSEVKQEVRNVVNEIDKAKLETEMLTLKMHLQRLQTENDVLHTRLKEFREEFNEQVLFRIPKYQEIELPASRFSPEYIVPYIGNALDKKLVKVFNDCPVYDFQSFDVIDKDQDGNITNALVKTHISFDKASPFNPIEFDLELWIVNGFLQIPTFFKYQNSIHTLDEQGIRGIEYVANKMDEQEARNRHDYVTDTWYTVNRERRNPAVPSQVEIPMSQHSPRSVWVNSRPY